MTDAAAIDAPSPETPVRSPALLAGAEQWDQTCRASGRPYRIFVSRPPAAAPAGGHPVMFFLDGNGMFPVALIARMRMFSGEIRPALLVGVGYPFDDMPSFLRERVFDLTPPTPDDYRTPETAPPYGGADALLAFILDELVPTLARVHPVDTADLSLFGDSLGGLFVLRALFTRPEAFRSYLAASPSIWWNDRAVLADEAAFAAKVRSGEVSPRVLVTVGALEQSVDALPPPPRENPRWSREEQARMIAEARMVDNARDLASRLADLSVGTGLEAAFVEFDGETHASVIPANISRAVSFALRP